MSVYEAVMKIGSWELTLAPSTPRHIRKLLTPFRHIVIMPLQLSTPMTDADMLARCRYHGIIHRPGPNFTVGGPGLAAYMGDEDYKGMYNWDGTTYNVPLASWFNLIVGGGGVSGSPWPSIPLTPGSIATTANFNGSFYAVPRRKILEVLCAYFDYEYRVNFTGTIDCNTEAILYPAAADGRMALAVHGESAGPDRPFYGIGADVGLEVDYDDYANYIYVRGATTYTGPWVLSTPWRRGDGDTVRREFLHEDQQLPDSAISTIATTLLFQLGASTGRRQVTVSTDLYDVRGKVKVGETMLVYDPTIGLTGSALDTVDYRGGRIRPARVRCLGMRWAISSGMGVYLRQVNSVGATPIYTDLTPYVEWEPPGAEFEVGAIRRGLR